MTLLRPTITCAFALSFAAAVTACGDSSQRNANATNPSVPPTTASAPPAGTSTTSASSGSGTGTPETHAGTPKVDAPPAPGARDTPANQPQSELSKSEEAHSMPKSGQVNNYNSPAYEPKRGAGGNSGSTEGTKSGS